MRQSRAGNIVAAQAGFRPFTTVEAHYLNTLLTMCDIASKNKTGQAAFLGSTDAVAAAKKGQILGEIYTHYNIPPFHFFT